MEHLNDANHDNKMGWMITIFCGMVGMLGHVTASDVLVYISIVSITVNIGFTLHKWWLMHKKSK